MTRKKKRNVRNSDGSEAEKDSIDFTVGRFISSHPRVLTKRPRKFRFQGDCRCEVSGVEQNGQTLGFVDGKCEPVMSKMRIDA